jgi:hypothetical protein
VIQGSSLSVSSFLACPGLEPDWTCISLLSSFIIRIVSQTNLDFAVILAWMFLPVEFQK